MFRQTVSSSGIAKIVMAASVMLSAAIANAQVVEVDPSARLTATFPVHGRGFCAQFTKGNGADGVNSLAEALNLLDDVPGVPERMDPDLTFFDALPVGDLHDGVDGSTGRQLGYNAFFPWSDPDDAWTTATCQSHGGSAGTGGSNRFAMRLRGNLDVPSAGTYTFAMRTDDGYSLRVGGQTISESTGLRSTLIDTRRVHFAEAGVYAIEVVYFENDGHAVFEGFIATSEVAFVSDVDNAAVASSGGVDLWQRNYDVLPAAFAVMSSATIDLPTWQDAGDEDCATFVDAPSTTCTMPAADGAINCGNGRRDAYSDGGSEACDDGNKVDGDGCSASCALEAGYACLRHPSVCGIDVDGDGVPDVEDSDPTDGPNGDVDGDGIANSTDPDNTDGPNGDVDGDGIANSSDPDDTDGPNGDVDGDGIANGVDPTPNGDPAPGGGTDTGGGTGAEPGTGTGDGSGAGGGSVDGGATDDGTDDGYALNPNGNNGGGDDGTSRQFGLSGSGCAATSPSGLMPFAMLAVGLFIKRRDRR